MARNAPLRWRVAQKLALQWSPEQIAGWLKRQFPTDAEMQVSHETIYRSLFVQTRGVLKKELMAHLRTRRQMRQAKGHLPGSFWGAVFCLHNDQTSTPSRLAQPPRTLKCAPIPSEIIPKLPVRPPSVSMAQNLSLGAGVSEETEGQDTGAEASGGVDPTAVALALGGASREDAHEFLKKQGALIDDQRHHLHEQLKQLHIAVWEKWLGVLLRVATAVVGIAVAAGLGLMVWDAAHSRGLLIEPFSVPPDMASRGLTGEVVAAQLLDKLAILGTSESSRSTQSYANNWGNDIKVEIPETGVSISELERFLRGWLGHDTRISGEVYHTASGIAVTARAGANGATFTGAESDLDALVQKSAEHVFESTQPYRYANYLDRNYIRWGSRIASLGQRKSTVS